MMAKRRSVKRDCRVTIGVREWDGPAPWARFPPDIPERQRIQAVVIGGPRSAIGRSAHGATDVEAVQAVIRKLKERGFSGVAKVERQRWPWPPLYPADG